MNKPRVRFCWHCMRKLHGNHFAKYLHPHDGYTRIVHKKCLKDLSKPDNEQSVHYGTFAMYEEDVANGE